MIKPKAFSLLLQIAHVCFLLFDFVLLESFSRCVCCFFFVFVYVCRGRGACGFFSLASHVFDFAIIPRRDRTRLRRDSDSNGQLCIEEKIGKKSNESKLFYIFLIWKALNFILTFLFLSVSLFWSFQCTFFVSLSRFF